MAAYDVDRVLIVEDDVDSRDALSLFLRREGYEVTAAGTAQEGLARLERERFDVVLVDYALPIESGVAMLRSARARGILGGAAAIVITAHPEPEGAEGEHVVRKPLDLDDLLREVERLLAATAAPRRGPLSATAPAKEPQVCLVLYIARGAPSSRRAVLNLRRQLEGYDLGLVDVTVRELDKHLVEAAQDRVDFTPTLVKRSPEPRAWLLGDLRDPQALHDLLQGVGLERHS